jgi:hypothetical protein
MKRLFSFLFPKRRRIVNIVLKAEAGFLTRLECLAEESGCTTAEIIDRAVGLYSTALENAKQGKVITFVYDSIPEQ